MFIKSTPGLILGTSWLTMHLILFSELQAYWLAYAVSIDRLTARITVICQYRWLSLRLWSLLVLCLLLTDLVLKCVFLQPPCLSWQAFYSPPFVPPESCIGLIVYWEAKHGTGEQWGEGASAWQWDRRCGVGLLLSPILVTCWKHVCVC